MTDLSQDVLANLRKQIAETRGDPHAPSVDDLILAAIDRILAERQREDALWINSVDHKAQTVSANSPAKATAK